MNTRPEVIGELRTMFKEGATPSRLIRHIVERHENEHRFHLLIQLYFLEAFAVPIVRGLNPIDDYQHADLRLDFLNEQLLHEMVQKRSEWDHGGSETWLDSLTATDDEQRHRKVRDAVPGELSRLWTQMTPKEKAYIHMLYASSHGQDETVKIMSRLLEALQNQVNELQAAPAGATG